MALENGTYVNSLVPANPASTDGLAQADDHIRLIKSTIKNTFPNLTGAVTATQADLNNTTSIPSTLTDLGITDGTNSQVLQTAGSGNFSFVSLSEGTTYTGGTGITVSGSTITCTVDTPAEVGLGNLSSNGNSLSGSFTASGNITAYSDSRLKSDVETIPDALAKVAKMRGVNFTMKDTGARSTGVIAQELQAVIPEAVHTNDDGYLSVAYGNLVGVLIEAINTLSEELEHLKQTTY